MEATPPQAPPEPVDVPAPVTPEPATEPPAPSEPPPEAPAGTPAEVVQAPEAKAVTVSRHRHPTTFQDSTNGRNIASGKLAAVYVEFGSFQWADSDIDRMAGVFGIVTGGNPAHDAHLARCCDTEPGAFVPGQVPEFIKARIALGHRDGMSYSDQAEWQQIEEDCIAAGVYPYWWIAAPGASLDECRALRSPVKGVQPVAVQNLWAQGFDQSVILQPASPAMQFTPPSSFQATG